MHAYLHHINMYSYPHSQKCVYLHMMYVFINVYAKSSLSEIFENWKQFHLPFYIRYYHKRCVPIWKGKTGFVSKLDKNMFILPDNIGLL